MGGFKGGERAPRLFDTRQQAIDAGQQMAKQGRGELLIHGENGRICARDSHDNDPCPLKGCEMIVRRYPANGAAFREMGGKNADS
ncbi:MAG: DUF2188 domain-containing protein [Pseudomonas sp.]|uniref:DUF2188 domain-containing protein n=1 Tax=Pseudomonas sp. TaxID=306 RepID=UPI003D6F2A86